MPDLSLQTGFQVKQAKNNYGKGEASQEGNVKQA
jgi:hypothetical protein